MSSALASSLQTTVPDVARAMATACSQLTPVQLSRLVVLAIYLSMNLGLPTGSGMRVVARPTANACRCSAESRAAGRCCCSSRSMTTTKRGCCAARPGPETKSCCATKASFASSDEKQTATWTGGCPCDANDFPSILLCPQPRILASSSSPDAMLRSKDRLAAVASVPCGDRPCPSVPPPEFAAL